jgi:hypothetical protein
MENLLTNPGDFHRWKDHPVTAAYLQFLRDRAMEAARLWATEAAPSEQMGRDQARAGTLLDLANLSVGDVRGFYNLPDIEGESE